jgi:TolA-binding protein
VHALLTLILLLAPDGGAGGAQKAFEAATALEGAGNFKAAAEALEKLARDQPADPYADDALFEAAVLSEERLSDPARAARLYEEVATKYPASRLARRARARADFLGASLKTGEAPLKEYQEILGGHANRPQAESVARMEKLLRDHPDFAVADRALYWLGTSYVELRRDPDAVARFLELERRFPTGEWAARAKKSRADLMLRTGHPLEAREIYQALGQHRDLLARAASEEGLAAVRSAIRRLVAFVVSILYLLGFFAVHGWALRKVDRRFRIPSEVWFYLPVAALFVLAGATENGSIALATGAIAIGGGLVVWASTAVNSARLAAAPLGLRARIARLGAAGLAVLCVTYLSVQSTGLTDLIVETLKNGPER